MFEQLNFNYSSISNSKSHADGKRGRRKTLFWRELFSHTLVEGGVSERDGAHTSPSLSPIGLLVAFVCFFLVPGREAGKESFKEVLNVCSEVSPFSPGKCV